jgi:SAM-dependent methyltransferase
VSAVVQYDSVATEYERRIAPRYRRVAELIAAEVDVDPEDGILDIGAGTGGLARLLLPRLGPTGRLVLVDVSERMLDVARTVLTSSSAMEQPALEFEVADLVTLPFAPGSFDHVVAQFTPLQDSDTGLAEAAKVLKPAGRLTIGFWGTDYPELDLLNRVRDRAGIDRAVPPDPAVVLERVIRAGFSTPTITSHRFDAAYDTAEEYLAYRSAFGRAVPGDDDALRRYWDALADEVGQMAARDGHVALDWSVNVLRAERT